MRLKTLEQADIVLRDYDVRDNGWVHEIKGRAFNVLHTQSHLSVGEDRYNFTSEADLRGTISPDALAYALRLARWNQLSYVDLLRAENEARDAVPYDWRHGLLPNSAVAWARAASTLASIGHDLDHDDTFREAVSRMTKASRTAAGLLIFSAVDIGYEYGDDPLEALTTRLDGLRARFDVTPRIPA